MSRQDPQMKIRLPEKLHRKIAEAAAAENRSMNAEIVTRLDMSFLHEMEGRQGDNASLRNEVMELRYTMMMMLEALLANDKAGMRETVDGVLSKYQHEIQQIARDGKEAHDRHIAEMREQPD